jgi:hypothetical protein
MPRVAGDETRHESAPLVACPSLPPPSSTQRLLYTSFARHCVPPHPCRRHLRALGTLELQWPCATRPHRPPLGGVNMECTNGQPAGYRRHREQSNPNAASRDQNGANKNPLHRRGFYRPPGFFCKSPHDREPTSGLEPLSPAPQLRVITQALQGCAEACKSRISRGLSLLRVAARCTVLRSRWYQSGVSGRIQAACFACASSGELV